MPIARQGYRNVGITEISEGTLTEDFGEVSVPNNTETVLATFSVPASKFVRIAGVYGEGGTNGIFRLYIDSTKIWQARNAWTSRNVFSSRQYDAQAAEVVQLRVIHQSTTHTFSGAIWGYENNA